MARNELHIGTVTMFDDAVGLGEVIDDAGRRHGFHCTAIADGSRTVAVGAAVRYSVIAGHAGSFEADALTPA